MTLEPIRDLVVWSVAACSALSALGYRGRGGMYLLPSRMFELFSVVPERWLKARGIHASSSRSDRFTFFEAVGSNRRFDKRVLGRARGSSCSDRTRGVYDIG